MALKRADCAADSYPQGPLPTVLARMRVRISLASRTRGESVSQQGAIKSGSTWKQIHEEIDRAACCLSSRMKFSDLWPAMLDGYAGQLSLILRVVGIDLVNLLSRLEWMSATAVAHGHPEALGSAGMQDTPGGLLQAASGSHSGL